MHRDAMISRKTFTVRSSSSDRVVLDCQDSGDKRREGIERDGGRRQRGDGARMLFDSAIDPCS